MPRDRSDNDLDLIEHMVALARTAQRLIVGGVADDLDRDEKLQLALVRALQIVGEAAWRTSAGFQAAHPTLPWKQIAGFRHRAVHDYFDIDNRVVWLIATTELQPIIDRLAPLIPPPLEPPEPF